MSSSEGADQGPQLPQRDSDQPLPCEPDDPRGDAGPPKAGQAETDMRALIEIAVARQNDVLTITAVEGKTDRIIYANPAIAKHSGYSVEEVVGNTPRMFQGPDTSRATLDLIRSAVDARQPIRAELLNYGKNGASYWTEIDITPIFDDSGQATHMVSVQRDVTARKNNRDAVQRSDKRFRLALKASANAIWEWNVATGEVEYRDEMPGLSWRGRNHGNTRGDGLRVLLDLVHPDDRDRIQQTLLVKIAGNDQLHIAEYRLRRPDGSYADVSDRQFILRNPDGTAERLIGSILDVSEKRELENRQRQSQRLELLGEMTGGIAHNFNNLLTVILGNVDRLRHDHPSGTPNPETIRLIDDAAQRGAKLTQDLMSFSHGKALTLVSVDAGRLVDQASPVWRNLLMPSIHLSIRNGPALWPVHTDKTHLEAALLNLVLNARDAMPDGGDLLVQTENIETGSDLALDDTERQASRYVMITVSDTGVGMPPEHVKAALDPFFTTKAPGEGTGLGLSSAHGFLQQSGGFIRLQSSPGKGTSVRVLLPADDNPPEPEVETGVGTLPPDGSYCILVVDDDPLVSEFVQAALTSLGHTVMMASNGFDALQLLGTGSKIDLLFTDILLDSAMNGWQLAILAQALFPGLPVLFTSADPDSAKPPTQALTGAINLLRKPYRIHDLSGAVVSAITAAEEPESGADPRS